MRKQEGMVNLSLKVGKYQCLTKLSFGPILVRNSESSSYETKFAKVSVQLCIVYTIFKTSDKHGLGLVTELDPGSGRFDSEIV